LIKLYERLIELLGRAQDDPAVTTFTKELGESPLLCAPIFHFPENGFHLIAFRGNFRILTLNLRDIGLRSGIATPYAGDLPAGILAGDGRTEVRKKLHCEPFRVDLVEKSGSAVKYSTEYFHHDTFVLQIEFELPTDVICSVIVRKEEDDDQEDISESVVDTPLHTIIPRSRPRQRTRRHR